MVRDFVNNIKDEQYKALIQYALKTCDYFMLVFCNYGEKAKKNKKIIQEELVPYLVKKRHNSVWPGTYSLSDTRFRFNVCFYKCCPEVEPILNKASALYDWEFSVFPEDLCFFRKDKCWLYTVAHEEVSGVIDITDADYLFFRENNIALGEERKNSDDFFVEPGLI